MEAEGGRLKENGEKNMKDQDGFGEGRPERKSKERDNLGRGNHYGVSKKPCTRKVPRNLQDDTS